MKLYDINVFDWGTYNEEGQARVCLDAYPVKLGPDGYYETDTSVDPISLELTTSELFDIGFMDVNDTWIHSDALVGNVEHQAPRVFEWLTAIAG